MEKQSACVGVQSVCVAVIQKQSVCVAVMTVYVSWNIRQGVSVLLWRNSSHICFLLYYATWNRSISDFLQGHSIMKIGDIRSVLDKMLNICLVQLPLRHQLFKLDEHVHFGRRKRETVLHNNMFSREAIHIRYQVPRDYPRSVTERQTSYCEQDLSGPLFQNSCDEPFTKHSLKWRLELVRTVRGLVCTARSIKHISGYVF